MLRAIKPNQYTANWSLDGLKWLRNQVVVLLIKIVVWWCWKETKSCLWFKICVTLTVDPIEVYDTPLKA